MSLFAILLTVSASALPASAVSCPATHNPVCAAKSDGQRAGFENACRARQAGAKVLHAGDCEAPGGGLQMCPDLYQPVCATDPAMGRQKTYANLCKSELADAKSVHEGACSGGG